MIRRADFSQIFVFEQYWSKRKHAFGTKRCHNGRSVPSAQGSGAGIGYPPRQGHWDATDFLQIFCAFTPNFLKYQNVKEKCAQKCAQTSAHKKNSAHQKAAQKSAHKNRFEHLSGRWKPQKTSAPNLCKTPAPTCSEGHVC